MTDMSNYLENALVNHVFRNIALTSPVTVYVALFTALTDAEAWTGTEVSTVGTAYARTAVTFGAPSNGLSTNSAIVTFPTATADWGTITHAAIFDASSGGNWLAVIKALAASKVVNNGDIIRFPVGNVSMTFAWSMGASGTATLNFGAFPGKSDASVAVTGQTGIVAGSLVEAWIRPVASADHSADEHMVETLKVVAGNIVAGTGFTIFGWNISQLQETPLGWLSSGQNRAGKAGAGTTLYGTWTIAWAWN